MVGKKEVIQGDIMEQYKDEMLKRYYYLYEKCDLIMAPLFHQGEGFIGNQRRTVSDIFLNQQTLSTVEDLLLSDGPMETTDGYNRLEKLTKDKGYLQRVGKCQYLKNKHDINHPSSGIRVTIFDLLAMVYRFINAQTSDTANLIRKLQVIDEFIRIARFQIDGNDWKSGMYLRVDDIMAHIPYYTDCLRYEVTYNPRSFTDIGVLDNNFIRFFSGSASKKDDAIHLTLEDKKKIFLYLEEQKNEKDGNQRRRNDIKGQ